MKTRISFTIAALLCGLTVLAQKSTPPVQPGITGTCNQNLINNSGTVKITCYADRANSQKLVEIITELLRDKRTEDSKIDSALAYLQAQTIQGKVKERKHFTRDGILVLGEMFWTIYREPVGTR